MKRKADWQPVYELTTELLAKQEEVLLTVRKLSENLLKRDPAAIYRARPKRVRLIKCTQAAFEMVPGLVSKAEFQDWTGLSNEELYEEVRAGRIMVHRPHEHRYALYYKREIARLTGWKL